MAKNYVDITLALAGVCQSALLVQQLAHHSKCDEHPFRILLHSLLDLKPTSVRAVYSDALVNLKIGLETLQKILNISVGEERGAELARYTLGLMVLERKLNRNRSAQNKLCRYIGALEPQLLHCDILSETIVSAIAHIYVDVISPLGLRIQVTGVPAILQNSQIKDKVRAVLLAGIRSAVLWQQVGGGRLQLMFSRRRLCAQTKQLLLQC
ncbi:high frequency lysogenization protein HflD [Candidatus Palibaumannia cicadellinicola]|uniref:High frequency lysogenization protein HflD homolog n=1 Tax=Candidatus Palibaumannia cicadellinicola TaxID=186490 RepID=A0A088MYJ1_9GAMM|nr:high frequency lysogenization protein HflD [Candidatus Baumannia cicadellinicola]AIN47342.1 putative lysogenization regulator [Candidatus Baumannia cicadellinicola]